MLVTLSIDLWQLATDSKQKVFADLDGTLARYDEEDFRPGVIGDPIEGEALELCRRVIKNGGEVVIFTARLVGGGDHDLERRAIAKWTKEHLGQECRATATKEKGVTLYLDDAARRVEKNKGKIHW